MNVEKIRAVLAPIPEHLFALDTFVVPGNAECRCASAHLLVAAGVHPKEILALQPAHPAAVYSTGFQAMIEPVLLGHYDIDLLGQLELENANDGAYEWEHLRAITTPKQRVFRLLSGAQLPWDPFPSEWTGERRELTDAELGPLDAS